MYRRLLLLSLLASSADAFVVAPPRGSFSRLYSTTPTEEIQSMRAGAIKKELESYGISTRTFLEKKELVEALNKARADGLKPKATSSSTSSSSSPSSSSSNSSTPKTEAAPEAADDSRPREERLAEEMEKCKTMKNGELKKELESRGISTKSFFEKSEFIKALANAIVDGVENGDAGGEGYAEYTNVEVLSANDAGPRTKKSGEAPAAQQSQQSPFGGGGGMPGGMGGIGDMLKNMGGSGGGMPGGMGGIGDMLGGMGGGGGDMMGQAQKMMQNPKVMELMMKAQSNPKMAKAMQEVMSNPAAFSKYQNDPEIAELLKELQELM